MSDQIHQLNAFAAEHRIAPAAGNILASEPPLDLPPIKSAATTLAAPPPPPPVLVEGLIHAGTKVMFGAGSKSHKTWLAMDLALSISVGQPWLNCNTTKSRVLYLDFELHEAFFVQRLAAIGKARGVEATDGFDYCSLRGSVHPTRQILTAVVDRIADKHYGLIILDPIYKLLAGRDENSAGQITEMLNLIEWVAVKTGAAVLFAAHFSKGNQGAKDALDRVSGSGVFARDPDTILTMTAHEEAGCFTINSILRNFPTMPPFCVRWECPLLHPANDLNPEDLKRPKRLPPSKKREPSLEEFVSIFPEKWDKSIEEALLTTDTISAAFRHREWDSGATRKLRDEAVEKGLLKVHRGAHNRIRVGRPHVVQDWRDGLDCMATPGLP